MVKNPHYWNADQVELESIDAMAISSDIAALNMYLTGQLDWVTNVPPTIIPEIRDRADFHSAPIASTYFYRLNCTRPPLDKPLVRKALSLAIDRQQICEKILRAGEVWTTSLVPAGLTSYQPQGRGGFDPSEAQRLLEEAGFPRGSGFPKLEILYNTHETHQAVAEVVQNDWKKYVGIDVELRGMEWGTYLNAQQTLEYDVSRAGWNADYLDPITFLDMFVKNGANNQTGWSNERYDDLIHQSASEVDPQKRLKLLQAAEQILLEEQPILPICHYTSKDFVQPYVAGFYCNRLKSHPLHLLKVDRGQRSVAGDSAAGGPVR
jgi:oligopeptide transport system substrate-binding protein